MNELFKGGSLWEFFCLQFTADEKILAQLTSDSKGRQNQAFFNG